MTAARKIKRSLAAWLPLLALPALAAWLTLSLPAWVIAWSLAVAIYSGMKWLTFARSRSARAATWTKCFLYLFLWPGMDAHAFFQDRPCRLPGSYEWSCALAKSLWGLALIVGLFPLLLNEQPLLAAWCGLVGIALVLLFGLTHLASVAWRTYGRLALPIMNRPLAATSLGDFWSNRWNLAFRDVVRRFVFQPLLARLDLPKATLAVFLVSGIVHDLVMSLPAKAGLGRPTLYFLIQGLAVLFERSRAGVRLGLGPGMKGRLFAAAIVLLPLALLFHRAFLENIIVPTLRAITLPGNF